MKINIRVSEAELAAYRLRAGLSGLTTHGWCVAVLRHVTGQEPLFDRPTRYHRGPGTTGDLPFRGASLSLQLSDELLRDARAAALRTRMPLRTWIVVVLNCAAGISDLPAQLQAFMPREREHR